MPVTPQFLAARAAEHQQRLITYLPRPPALRLPIHRPRGWRRLLRKLRYPWPSLVCPVVHLTERHCLELRVTANALLTDRAPLLGDVQKFLWRLHPWFFRPDGTFPNLAAGAPRPSYRQARRALRRLVRLVPLVDLFAAEIELNRFIAATQQDLQPPADAQPVRSRIRPEPCYYDSLAEGALRAWNLTPAQVLDLPRALVFQLQRNALLRDPSEADLVTAPSDALLSAS